jgi:hypothetical protein
MPISREDAADALREISRTQETTSRLQGYRHAAPHLIVWGLIWAIGYSADYYRADWRWVWPVLVVIGTAASFWFGMRSQPKSMSAGSFSWPFVASFLAVAVFIGAVFSIMQPVSGAQVGAFFPLLSALFYTLIGIWTRAGRMLITGAALAVLTLVGFFGFREYFALWMAVVGGGGLILGGLWLARA